MTQIMISRRSGIAREPNGTLHRVVAGMTTADARHPLVVAHPQDWQPMALTLPAPDDDAETVIPGAGDVAVTDLRERLAEAEQRAEACTVQLSRIVELLAERGALPDETEQQREGWLADALAAEFAELDEVLEDETAPALADPETPEGRAEIRRWAREAGLEVSDRGALSRAVIDAYRAAHGGTES